jgi:hypothetical protein
MFMVSRATSFVHETFVVGWEQAERMATELLDAVEAKGGDSSCVEIERLAKSIFGTAFEWRSQSAKAEWEKSRGQTAASYNQFIDSSKPWYRR